MTVHPPNQSLALKKRKIIKVSRGTFKRPIERYFVVNKQMITFFEKEGDKDFKKNARLEGSFAFIESINEFDPEKE